jgi:hypothetical protein
VTDYAELMGLRPQGLGPADGAGDADDRRRIGGSRLRSAVLLGALIAMGADRGQPSAAVRRRRLHDGAPRHPDLLVIYLLYFGGSEALTALAPRARAPRDSSA